MAQGITFVVLLHDLSRVQKQTNDYPGQFLTGKCSRNLSLSSCYLKLYLLKQKKFGYYAHTREIHFNAKIYFICQIPVYINNLVIALFRFLLDLIEYPLIEYHFSSACLNVQSWCMIV